MRVPNSTTKNVDTGYVAKPVNKSGIEIVIDARAPIEENSANLRV